MLRVRAVLPATLLCLGVVTAQVATPPPATAQVVDLVSLDWKSAGDIEDFGRGNALWLQEKVVFYLENENPQPSVITVQEVCRDQAQNLWESYLVGEWGTQYAFYPAVSGVPNVCGGQQFGNATFIRGGGSVGNYVFNTQDTSSSELRGMACQNWANGTPPYFGACSIHTAAGNTTVANAQIQEAETAISSNVAAGYQYMAIGDLNIVYGGTSVGLSSFYASFDEADQVVPPPSTATNSNGKIDYVFLSRNTPGFTADLTVGPRESDHNVLLASFSVNL